MFCETDVFTVAEFAEKIKCSTDTVYRLIKSGDLGCVRVRDAIRICGWQANAYIKTATNAK